MERLTIRNNEGVAVFKTPYECDNCSDEIYRLPDYGNGSPTDILAEYEDAEEQCIEECGCSLREVALKYQEFLEHMHELAEYWKAEKEGLLLRLPCKVGDKAYIIVDKIRVYEMEIMGIYPFGAFYEDEEKEISRVYNLYLDGNVYYKHCTFYDIGKTVFLTKEEAEQSLANMQSK